MSAANVLGSLPEFDRKKFLINRGDGKPVSPPVMVTVISPPVPRLSCYGNPCDCPVVYYVAPEALEAIYRHPMLSMPRLKAASLEEFKARHNPPRYGFCICGCMGSFI